MPEVAALARNMKTYRKRFDKSQEKMSEATGLSVEEISLIERGLTDPKLSTLQKIAACMGVSVSTLLENQIDGELWDHGKTNRPGL